MELSTDYPISEHQQKLWKVELEIADVLLDICKRFDLRIWACFGTLLGAARHKGFIPWDDDIDFVMMRPDYDRLVYLCQQHEVKSILPNNISFDLEDISVLKLRRSDTAAIIPSYRYCSKFNQGVWVDVFCLDVAPDDLDSSLKEFNRMKTKERLYRNRKFAYYSMSPSTSFCFRHAIIRLYFIFINLENFRNSIEVFFRRCKDRFSGRIVWPFLIWSLAKDVQRIPRYDSAWFDDTVMMPFEDREFPCPSGWEKILTSQYGDWRIPVKGGSLHEGVVIDLEQSYTELVENKLNSMPFWKRYWYKN